MKNPEKPSLLIVPLERSHFLPVDHVCVLEGRLADRVLGNAYLVRLSMEKGVNPLRHCGPQALHLAQLLDGGAADLLERSEVPQQRLLPTFAHPRDLLEHRPEIFAPHQPLLEGDRKAVRLISSSS